MSEVMSEEVNIEEVSQKIIDTLSSMLEEFVNRTVQIQEVLKQKIQIKPLIQVPENISLDSFSIIIGKNELEIKELLIPKFLSGGELFSKKKVKIDRVEVDFSQSLLANKEVQIAIKFWYRDGTSYLFFEIPFFSREKKMKTYEALNYILSVYYNLDLILEVLEKSFKHFDKVWKEIEKGMTLIRAVNLVS